METFRSKKVFRVVITKGRVMLMFLLAEISFLCQPSGAFNKFNIS